MREARRALTLIVADLGREGREGAEQRGRRKKFFVPDRWSGPSTLNASRGFKLDILKMVPLTPFTSPHAKTAAGAAPALAALLYIHNPAFARHRPGLDPAANAVIMARWAMAYDPLGAGPGFGPYMQCDPIARCLGCELFCSTEAGLVALSARCAGRSVLMVEPQPAPDGSSVFAVRTFVPGLPGQSGVFRPMVDHEDGQLILVDLARGLSAALEADGSMRLAPLRRSQLGSGLPTAAAQRFWQRMQTAGFVAPVAAAVRTQP